MSDYLATADANVVLDIIAAEFQSYPPSVRCFDLRVVQRAIELSQEWQARQQAGYPTPDLQLEGQDERVQRIVGDVRGAFSTTRGTNPVFERLVNVEAVVRFVLLRSDYGERHADKQRT